MRQILFILTNGMRNDFKLKICQFLLHENNQAISSNTVNTSNVKHIPQLFKLGPKLTGKKV